MIENIKSILTTANILYLVALLIVSIFIMLILGKIRQKAIEQLNTLLYVQNDAVGYLTLLENKKLTIVFKKSTIMLYKLDGHLICGNSGQINFIFDEISKMKLEPKEKIEFNMKKLSYYACEGNKEKSESALACIEKILNKEEKYKYIVQEAQLIFDIYINKNTKNISKLKAMFKNEKGSVQKGITLYRIAKLEHFDGRDAKAEEALLSAKGYLKGTHWYEICCEAIKNKDVLDYK